MELRERAEAAHGSNGFSITCDEGESLIAAWDAGQRVVTAYAVLSREADHLGQEQAELELGDAVDALFRIVGESNPVGSKSG